jgi:hypothetical protein
MALSITQVMLIVILAMLAGVAYSLRVMVLMERRLASMETHIERIANKILSEEIKIHNMVGRRK